ncbi:hypothetical protein [Streptosporangium sp. H16]|uniref:hypothetical protein n=1 Tax=Streptosporangium sp. H16 TaxID=3444184 RepID=UPI003F78B1D5
MIGDGELWVVGGPMWPEESRARLLLRSGGVELDGRWFVECGKPDCDRVVPESVRFCCTPCAVAAEGRYEIDRHSASCDSRGSEREARLRALFGDL